MKKVLFVVTMISALASTSAFAGTEKAAKVAKEEKKTTVSTAVWKPKIRI